MASRYGARHGSTSGSGINNARIVASAK